MLWLVTKCVFNKTEELKRTSHPYVAVMKYCKTQRSDKRSFRLTQLLRNNISFFPRILYPDEAWGQFLNHGAFFCNAFCWQFQVKKILKRWDTQNNSEAQKIDKDLESNLYGFLLRARGKNKIMHEFVLFIVKNLYPTKYQNFLWP